MLFSCAPESEGTLMKIVVLAGGLSTERQVALTSGTGVCKALRQRGHKAILVDMFLGLESYDGALRISSTRRTACAVRAGWRAWSRIWRQCAAAGGIKAPACWGRTC